MQKKLIAIAVAGALGVPAVALAQTSTVSIYGNITYEYGIVDSGSGRPKMDYADSPGGSAIGFRGEEKLGGGLSAWFQCETSADVRAYDQIGLCSRNSAVGFKGGFGNIHFGRWDTPFKRAMNVATIGQEETGILGTSWVAFGGSGGASAAGPGNNNVDVFGESSQRGRWKRREAGLTYYESPNFSGIQILGAFSPGNAAADQFGATDATINPKPRIQSLSGIYSNGPLNIGLGYERHRQMVQVAGAGNDRGWGGGVSYTFGRVVTVGFVAMDAKYQTAPGRTLGKKTWNVGVDWHIAGPHSLQAAYTHAGDSTGNSLVAVQRNDVSGPDTGAQDYTLTYSYAFSKRTRIKFGYRQTNNDANTLKYAVGNAITPVLTKGDNTSGWAFHIKHLF